MGHEIGSTDIFAGVGVQSTKRAWHGLGDEIPEGLGAVEAFQQTGLGWETELLPVHAERQIITADGVETKRIELPNHKLHIRADSGAKLGMVSDGYTPFENMQLAKLADSLVDEGHTVSVETCGSLYNGRRVYILVKLPRTIVAAPGDTMQQYILIGNGHGGFAALTTYPTSIRVVCANTLRWSERDIAKGAKFRHSGDFETKVKQARLMLGLAEKENDTFEQQVKALVAKQLGVSETFEYMHRSYDKCFGKIDMEGDADTVAKLLKKRDEVTAKWMANVEDPKQQIEGIRGTAWAAYNAVSQWHDHERGRYKSVHESGARVHSNIFGKSQEHKLRAFREAMTVASK